MEAFYEEKPVAFQPKKLNAVILILIVIGCFFRVFHFFDNRSLWLDEMYLSSSLIKMDFFELAFSPLDYQQKAPIGYLWLVKLCVILFGKSDMVLRLIPLLGGILSMIVFVPVAKSFLKNVGVIAAIGIIALSPHVIYHSVEAKQYSTEVLSSILSLYLFTRYHNKTDYRSLLLWGLWGAIIVWFSFSSIFVLAGIAGGVSLYHLIHKNWRMFFLYLAPFVLWMLSFGINYIFFTSRFSDSGWLVQWFLNREGFMPSGLRSGLVWTMEKAFSFFDFPLGLSWFSPPSGWYGNSLILALVRMVIIPVVLLLAGLIYLFKKNLELLFVLILPLLLHLFATLLLIYPFYERLTVYLSPLIALIIAKGIEYLSSRSTDRSSVEFTSAGVIGAALTMLLLFGPLMHSTLNVLDTDRFGYDKNWKQRDLYQYVNSNFRDGDVIYVYWNGLVPYHYYKQVLDFKFSAVEGKDHRFTSSNMTDYLNKLKLDLASLEPYKRVWIVQGDNFVLNIGDFDNQPPWYYNSKDYIRRKHGVFNTLGKKVYNFNTQENINLMLFEKEKL